MTEWYEKSHRRNLVDMHIEDWDDEFLSRFDPGEYFQCLQAGHVASPMIYFQSHVGLCYWPTGSGRMHRAFVGRETAMRTLFDLCHEAGMDVIAYYSLIYNNWAYETHPDWRMIDASGEGSRARGGRYGLCCPNNHGYREFLFAQIGEFCGYFDFEGIFFDMTFWPMVCYCDSCRERWASEAGGIMPTVIDWSDAHWLVFQEKREDWLGGFAAAVTAELKKRKPACSVEHQYSTAMHFWRFGVGRNVAEASDYSGGDLYGGLAEQSFACKLYYNTTRNQPFEYMTSRCYPNLLDHTTTKTEELLSLSVMTTLLHHGACLMIDAIDPQGTLDRRVYERIGAVYREAARYEPFLEGGMVQDVGIYFSLEGKMDVDRSGIPVGSPEGENSAQPHQAAALGAAASLRGHHIPFGVVNNWRLEKLGNLRVLVLPDVPFMGQAEVDAVRAFVKEGGSLYLSGHSAPRLVEEIFSARFAGFTEEATTYMAPTTAGQEILPAFSADYPLTLFVRQAILADAARGEILATMTLPYTVPPARHILGAVTVAELPRFAAIHSDPPGRRTDRPAILRTAFGKGSVVWASAPIEAAGRPQHDDAFAAVIHGLNGGASFSSDAPDAVELVLFAAPEKGRRSLGLLNLQDRFKPLPVGSFDVRIRTPRKPRMVLRLPEREAVHFTYADGSVGIHFEGLALFAMVEIVD